MTPSIHPIDRAMARELTLRMGLGASEPVPEIPLAGSPERSQGRMAIRTEKGLFVLERFSPNQAPVKNRIARLLFQLQEQKMPWILPPLQDGEGKYLMKQKGYFYQLTPYIQGENLPRPEYTKDGWRGRFFAAFICHLLEKGSQTGFRTPFFDIIDYIRALMEVLQRREPSLYQNLLGIQKWVIHALTPLMPHIPVKLCHGDLHPVNALFEKKELLYIIDWEFCGSKPEIHDLANLLGCLGSEDPVALQEDFALQAIRGVNASGLLSSAGLQALFPMVVAIRFCWLSEWLRKQDLDMISLEQDYLKLLIHYEDAITRCWFNASA
ncbi:phosphotransferase [Desulfobotulus sp. H1]|uniref:Phosphotransferase n=1 Tax=Desulfobotulus pelophilus TaxID=2823377 RepID=A0ABT3N6I8_9BACT|nr:phosphotransferase [Desulfobotulus pelophilus]MCW7753082.1 phosphotransferase [Desulfobotulus pelophilus]